MPRNTLAKHDSPAARQAAFRHRRDLGVKTVDALIEELIGAFDRGRSGKIVDNLPEDKQAKMEELIARLSGIGLIAVKPETPEMAADRRKRRRERATKQRKA